jgi:hypothetical protein
MPCAASQPARSRNASSIEIGLTSGVSANISERMDLATREYLIMSGGNTTASGQSLTAAAIGIAERTPWVRAM